MNKIKMSGAVLATAVGLMFATQSVMAQDTGSQKDQARQCAGLQQQGSSRRKQLNPGGRDHHADRRPLSTWIGGDMSALACERRLPDVFAVTRRDGGVI